MKKLASFILCLSFVFSAFAKNADAFFEDFVREYRDAMYISYTYISKVMMDRVDPNSVFASTKMDIFAGMNIKDKLSSIQIIQVNNKTYDKRLLRDAVDRVVASGFERVLRLQNLDSTNELFFHKETKDKNGTSPATLILVYEDRTNYSVFVFTGNFTLDDVVKKK